MLYRTLSCQWCVKGVFVYKNGNSAWWWDTYNKSWCPLSHPDLLSIENSNKLEFLLITGQHFQAPAGWEVAQ